MPVRVPLSRRPVRAARPWPVRVPRGLLAGSRCRARDAGMATAEYAIATLAACGFAGVLLAILGSGQVKALLLGIVRRALSVG